MNDGYDFKVTIESGMRGVARLNVARMLADEDDPENSQGIDLTPNECRALAKMLEAVAISVEAMLEIDE
ncbi:MAG: hypothetical protein EPN72_15150 [Nevskiaceae bacterium]|nr:MAG: hypothetical protein EPN72_15150 [Nevskiaceae bacterium]